MDNKIFIIDGIYVTVISMGIVFIILLSIALILSSFKIIFKNKDKNLNEDEIALTNEEDDEEKIVAALAASIMARSSTNPNLRIKSIKRVR